MAGIPKEHEKLYFDVLCRTKKLETVLSLIQATYHAKTSGVTDVKGEIAKRLENAYNLFKDNVRGQDSGSGTYSGTMKQFESQYTIGHELCIWSNSDLDLTPKALAVAENKMTIREYFDIFFLSYFQPVDNKAIHVLYLILRYMINHNTKELEKADIPTALGVGAENEDINALCNFLDGTSYIRYEDKKLIYVGDENISDFIKRCNIKYIGSDGLTLAINELKEEEKYIEYIMSGTPYDKSGSKDADFLRDEYKKWLETAEKDNGEKYKSKVQGNYLWAIGKASEYLNLDIYSILNYQKLVETIDIFLNNDELMNIDKNKHNYTVSNGLKLYKKFFREFFGIDFQEETKIDDKDIEEKIKELWNSKDFDYVDAKPLYDEFNGMFGVDAIRNFTDDECLDKMFGKVGDNSLVYNLEHVSKFDYFGHVGGYRTIYALYEKDGVWKDSRNPRSIKEISREDAIKLAVDYRDSLVNFFDALQSLVDSGEIKTREGYLKLQTYAKEKLGILYGRNWVWKYCHILFPDVFTTFYTNDWVNRIFRIANLSGEPTYIMQCSKFAEFCQKLEISIVYVYHILLKLDFSDEPVIEEEEENTMLPSFTKRTNKTYPLNMILYGAPGTGKTYATAQIALAILEKKADSIDDIVSNKIASNREELMKAYKSYVDNGQVVFTTFHQSYGYEDFIQGLRPDDSSEKLSFKPVDGVFKRIANKALENPNNNYVIIIDEINRGNISKVLGELITLVEEDKRWGEVNALSITLPSGDVFVVPNNLYIVGTMNSADKSISLIDAALRRRFSFVEVSPDSDLVSDSTLKEVLKTINKKLESELESTDLLVGHAYFIGKSKDDLADIMNRSIVPLLYEYFFDNKNKVLNILKEALKDTGFDVEDKIGRRLKVVKA